VQESYSKKAALICDLAVCFRTLWQSYKLACLTNLHVIDFVYFVRKSHL